MMILLRSVATLALALVAVSALAQDLEPVPFPPYDPNVEWRPRLYPEYNCDELPLHAPDPRELGLAEALAAVERRELSTNGLGDALAWAERARDPAHIPVLKRIVEGYRCADFDVGIAFLAIEAAGEPVEYFLEYALDWAYDDKVADWAMNALATRGDTTGYRAMRASILQAPESGPRGRSLPEMFNAYVNGVLWRSSDAGLPLRERFELAGIASTRALSAVIYEGPDGPELSVMTTSGNTGGARMRRDAWRLARAYPSVMEGVLRAYEDTARVELAGRGIAPEHVPLFIDEIRRQGRELMFPEAGPPIPPAVAQAAVRPTVCIGGETPGRWYSPGSMSLALSYESDEAEAVRVPYGPLNRLDGPWADDGGPFVPRPPEVFTPNLSAEDRTFRTSLMPGETATWTLLGQTVAAGLASPRCDGTDPLVLTALPAALVVAGDASAAFNGSAFAVSGMAHDLSGTLTDDVGVPALVAPTDDALAATLAGLSARQRDRLDGDATAAPLVISPASWAARLSDRATVTLGARPGSVGSPEAPVVAHAPDGARLDGNFEGWGVLVVDGPLSLRGDARWTGLVIVRGGADLAPEVDVLGSPSVVGGLVLGEGATLALGGRAQILYSPAALALAREAALATD